MCPVHVSGEWRSWQREELKRKPGVLEAQPGGWEPLGEGKPELSFSLQASRCRNRRSELSPLPSASDTAWMEILGAECSQHWSLSGDSRQPKNMGRQGTHGESLDKEPWAPRSSTACTGGPSWSWDESADRGDGWPPQTAPCWGSALRPSPRRKSPGKLPAEGGRQEWARAPPARPRRGAKDHSLGTVTWVHF